MEYRIAGALLIAENSDLLLQLRDDKPDVSSPGKISIFGGHIEGSETFLDAAQREISEETGLVIEQDNFELVVGVSNTYPSGSATTGAFYVVEGVDAKEMTITEGTLIRIPQNQIAKHMTNIVPTTLFAIAQYLSLKTDNPTEDNHQNSSSSSERRMEQN